MAHLALVVDIIVIVVVIMIGGETGNGGRRGDAGVALLRDGGPRGGFGGRAER